jgi:hypothetical protein
MSTSSLAGWPATITTTSSDLSVMSLTRASSFDRKLASASAIGAPNIRRYSVVADSAVPLRSGPTLILRPLI